MKKVFQSAEQAIHVWTQQTQTEGKSANIFFEKEAIYSYGCHYPLGLIVTNKKGEKAAIINNAGYSSTTAKHIGYARNAVNHYTCFLVSNTEAMGAIVGGQRYNQPERIISGLSEAIERCITCYNYRLRNDKIKRKPATLESWKSETLSKCNSYIILLDFFRLKMTPKARNALKVMTGKSAIEARESAQKAANIEAKKHEKARIKKEKENEALIKLAIPAWIEGIEHIDSEKRLYNTKELIRHQPVTYMRIKGENIETSHGAMFPVTHAVKAWPLINKIKESGTAWEKNGHTIHLGEFQIDRIETDGTIKAGCHTVAWNEIERIAIQLKLI